MMLETTVAGSLPKPSWLAEPECPSSKSLGRLSLFC
jgi:methionine synthase II (cobalamin-independent)